MNDVSLNEIAPPRQDWLGEVGRYFPNQIQNEQEVHKLTKGRNCSEYTDLITQCFVVVFFLLASFPSLSTVPTTLTSCVLLFHHEV